MASGAIFGDEHCSYRAELCYISYSLASPALSLQATSTHISSLHELVAARKIFEKLVHHGLSNRIGRIFFFMDVLST